MDKYWSDKYILLTQLHPLNWYGLEQTWENTWTRGHCPWQILVKLRQFGNFFNNHIEQVHHPHQTFKCDQYPEKSDSTDYRTSQSTHSADTLTWYSLWSFSCTNWKPNPKPKTFSWYYALNHMYQQYFLLCWYIFISRESVRWLLIRGLFGSCSPANKW